MGRTATRNPKWDRVSYIGSISAAPTPEWGYDFFHLLQTWPAIEQVPTEFNVSVNHGTQWSGSRPARRHENEVVSVCDGSVSGCWSSDEVAEMWSRWTIKVPVSVYAPIVSAITLGIIGLLALSADLPWLFASLGPTVAMQSSSPTQPISRPWNVAVGHLIALGAGFGAVYATGAVYAPSFLDSHPLAATRVGAAALAVCLGMGIEFLLKASHPPGAATTLLIALGLVPANARTAGAFACGIALVTLFGEAIRRMRIHLDREAA